MSNRISTLTVSQWDDMLLQSAAVVNHHFHCTITARVLTAEITYKSSTNKYWTPSIHPYWGEQLVISDHCPSHYCNTVNSTILTTGLTTEGINTTIQCDPNSNRQGLLRSQCTPGTSSQFGSFRCAQSTFAGLPLVCISKYIHNYNG